ncbi:hypothetical protein V8D89_004389 [Ganoderma adspersum]
MANSAYTEPDKSGWYDIGPYWNVRCIWFPPNPTDGFLGHISLVRSFPFSAS